MGWAFVWPRWLGATAPEPRPTLAESMIPANYLIIIAGILILIVVLQIYGHRRRKPDFGSFRRVRDREKPALLGDQQGMHSDMQELLVELQELSREINAQIDTKFAKLQATVRDADARIEQLERLIRAAADVSSLDVTVADQPRADSAPDSPPDTVESKKTLVYALADAGKTPLQIAEETGGNTGEIELILALRNKEAH